MNILLTGANGQLGRAASALLASRGHDVTPVDLPAFDIASADCVASALDAARYDAIFNAAAYTAVDRAEGPGKADCWRANATGPGVLADAAARRGVFLLHVSTDYVFPGDRPVPAPYVETDATGPKNEYGRAKLAGEEAIRASGARAAILRTAWLYGHTGRNFVKAILCRVRSSADRRAKVVADQFGSPTCAEDLARQALRVVEARAEGLFHATSQGFCTWCDFARAFCEDLQVEADIVPCATSDFPTAASRPSNSILDNAALRAAGLDCFGDWREALSSFLARHGEALLAETAPEA